MSDIGLDMGTGFVKCVCDYGKFRFPSLYAKRINGAWTDAVSEAVGEKAARMLKTIGTTAITPIRRGRPQKQFQKQTEMLVLEAMLRVRRLAEQTPSAAGKARVVVGLPYEAAPYKGAMLKTVGKMPGVERCDVVAQAAGTLIAEGKRDGMVVSIGQGTSEVILIEDGRIIDGRSLEWASEFVTRKVGRYAHLDEELLAQNKAICVKYAKPLAENLSYEIGDVVSTHGHAGAIIVSGGGILIPGVRRELEARLKGLEIVVPKDPVMSNAQGLYILAKGN